MRQPLRIWIGAGVVLAGLLVVLALVLLPQLTRPSPGTQPPAGAGADASPALTPAAAAGAPQGGGAPPAPPRPFAPLLYDDFSQITSGWTPLFVDPKGTVNGYSAESFAFSTASPDQLLYNVLPDLSFAPTHYGVEIQPDEGDGIFGLMLEVRGDPADYAGLAYYGVGVSTTGDVMVLVKGASSGLQVLKVATGAISPRAMGETTRLTIDRQGDHLSVLVDGAEALSVTAPTQGAGTVGFFVRAADRLAVRFDNLQLMTGAASQQPPCAEIRPLFDLASGDGAMSGGDVTIVQRRLARLGYDPGPEGPYGPQTAAAVAQLQASAGLPADGVVGPETWCALLSGDAPLANSGQSERAAVRERYRPLTLAPDGELPTPLLVSVRGAEKRWQIALALPGRTSLHYIDTGGDALDPAWSPGQGLLAFTSYRTGSEQGTIWILDTGSGALRQVSPDTLDSTFPTWSPDGRALMFTTQPLENDFKQSRNYVYTVADGRLTQWGDEQTGWSDWSQVGTVLFTRWTGRSFDIFAASPDGSNAVNLTNTDDYHEDIASWSPGGDRIAFVRNPKSAPDDRQLYIMQADGTEVQQITTMPGPNSNPIWLDATTLAFAHQPSEEVRLPYLLHLSGGVRPLIKGDERVWFMQRFDHSR